MSLLWKSWNWFECGVGIVLICFGAVASALGSTQPLREMSTRNISWSLRVAGA